MPDEDRIRDMILVVVLVAVGRSLRPIVARIRRSANAESVARAAGLLLD